jgi:multidrug transporter EmrE-like cation transporter
MFIFYIILTGVCDAIASVILRIWVNNHNILFLILGALGFAIAALFFALSMQYKGLAIANILWISLATIILTLLSFLIFKENLSTLQIIGIIIVFIGTLLVIK